LLGGVAAAMVRQENRVARQKQLFVAEFLTQYFLWDGPEKSNEKTGVVPSRTPNC
jgi:hypothetical protein